MYTGPLMDIFTEDRVLILGSGLSGLMTAYELAQKEIKSLILSKGPLIQTNTWKAQGGIAAAVSQDDSIETHLKDTLIAGAGLCIQKNVEKILELGPPLITQLISEGMKFDAPNNKISLGKEGGHEKRRILHVDDRTGQALHEFLLNKLHNTPLAAFCETLPNTMVLNIEKKKSLFEVHIFKDSLTLQTLKASHIILATGGAGKAFLYTSNWDGATGDGFRLAHSLGAELVNLEMIQFHPTCLYHPHSKNFLISEALRGEGAKLIDHNGDPFTKRFHPLGDLAPRDIVSRAIEHSIKSTGKNCVYLDITHKSREYLQSRFPTIYQRCLELGFDLSKEPVPVVPAAHYTCGGIKTKNDLVSTSIENLYVVGECGYTGLHGANRLASNSLLECLATAHLCANKISKEKQFFTLEATQEKTLSSNLHSPFLINALWDEVRSLMWNYVGIQRSVILLKTALSKLETIETEIHRLLQKETSLHLSELANLTFFSKACVQAALLRTESRGCHFITDYPNKASYLYNTVIKSDDMFREDLDGVRLE